MPKRFSYRNKRKYKGGIEEAAAPAAAAAAGAAAPASTGAAAAAPVESAAIGKKRKFKISKENIGKRVEDLGGINNTILLLL